MHLIDRTNHAPAVVSRSPRRKTKAIVLHRIKHETERLVDVDGVVDFWMRQPWGVATATIADATERLRAVQQWTTAGEVPADYLARAFVPYHAVVSFNGTVHQFLPWGCKGAHAYPNSKLVGVAFVGDFRTERLTQSQMESGSQLLRDLMAEYPDADVLRHDDAKRRYGKTVTAKRPKGCPGRLFPFDDLVEMAKA